MPLRALLCPARPSDGRPSVRRTGLVLGLLLPFASALSAPPAAGPSGGVTEAPLAAHGSTRADTLFTLLAPEATGIRVENRYDDPRLRGSLYQEFDTSSIGTGVALGDFDGDGRPDVFVVAKTDSCRLFRNLGGWKFEDVTDRAGVGDHGPDAAVWKQGAAFVDVDNDGRLDLYLCRFDAPNRLYINQGDGTFREEAAARGLDLRDSSVMAAFADYDRDGWLDVYVTTNILSIERSPGGQRGRLFHNRGDGTFEEVTDHAGLHAQGQSHSATWWDFDNDGWPDLYVGFDYGVPDQLYRNNHDGTFAEVLARTVPHTAFSSMGSDVGDVNNDGRIDLLVADMAATTAEADQRFLADSRSRSPDPGEGELPMAHRNALLLNTGTARCQEAAFLAGVAATDWTWSVRLEDLDNDGRVDLFATNGFHRTPSVDVIQRMVNASSPEERRQIIQQSPVQTEANIALRNCGDLSFENVGHAWGLDERGVSFGAAFGDLDGDGDLDLVYTNFRQGPTVLRNDAETGHRVIVALRGTRSNRFGIDALVTVESALGLQSRVLTPARGYLSTSEPVLHFGLGHDTVIRRLTVRWSSGRVQVVENLPVDRRFTLTEPEETTPGAPAAAGPAPRFHDATRAAGLDWSSKSTAGDETAAQPLLPWRLEDAGPALAVAELSAGGPRVVALGGTGRSAASLRLETQPGRFAAAASAAVSASRVADGPILWLDADNDGHPDLLVTRRGNHVAAHTADYQPRLSFGDAHAALRPAPTSALPPFTESAGALAAADFDGDGRIDVFLGARNVPRDYPAVPASALWRNLGGRFEDVTDALAPALRRVGLVTAALWSDVDGDHWPDLVVTLDWDQVRLFHNEQGRGFVDWTERAGFASAGTGWWRAVAAADFNGDGRPDFVVGNAGLNTPYRASRESPALLWVGDFKGDGGRQLIEAREEAGRLYPWRTRRDLGRVFPALLRQYPENSDFARADLAALFGADTLAAAQRLAATELRSGVLLSQPGGAYRFEPLPRLAQLSPFEAIAVGDFNRDGCADIVAVQNAYAPVPATGRFDGGLGQLLLGDGRGRFRAVSPAESGLVVPGDAKAVVAFDYNRDGWLDVLVAQHNGPTLLFENRARPDESP